MGQLMNCLHPQEEEKEEEECWDYYPWSAEGDYRRNVKSDPKPRLLRGWAVAQ